MPKKAFSFRGKGKKSTKPAEEKKLVAKRDVIDQKLIDDGNHLMVKDMMMQEIVLK